VLVFYRSTGFQGEIQEVIQQQNNRL